MRKMLRNAAALLLSLLMMLQPIWCSAEEPGKEPGWEITLDKLELKTELHTTKDITHYGGTVTTEEYDDFPADGKIFAIATFTIRPLKPDVSVSLADVTLDTTLESFSRMVDDSFLARHEYSVSGQQTALSTERRMSVCFEVPASYTGQLPDGWTLRCGDVQSLPYVTGIKELPEETTLLDRQAMLEEQILASYRQQRSHALADAKLILNPYEIAPLSALVLFETSRPCDVQVTVHGKNGPDFSYTLSEQTTRHEVSVIGLYPDTENTVTIVADGQSRDFKVKTSALPDDFPQVKAVAAAGSTLSNGLIYAASEYRYLFDTSGQIRWYSTIKQGQGDPSSAEEVSAEDGIWYATFYEPRTLYHLSWLGKVLHCRTGHWIIMHHDGAYAPDNHFLFFSSSTEISSMDLKTGEVNLYLDMCDLLQEDVGHLELRQNAPGDPFHLNTIAYRDGYLYLSLRNQHMLMKIDYKTHEIDWVLTPAYTLGKDGKVSAIQKGVSDRLLLPDENEDSFAWFYSQHHVTPLPDLDGDPNTEDITVFDNNIMRGVKGLDIIATPNNEQYSRMVHYRIDLTTRKVWQVFSWGENEEGRWKAHVYGSTQYIPQEQVYLGCYIRPIAEVGQDGTLKGHWELSANAYRVQYVSSQEWGGLQSFLGTKPVSSSSGYLDRNWREWIPPAQNAPMRYDITSLTHRSDNLLSIKGWAYIPGEQAHARWVYLVLQSNSAAYKINCYQDGPAMPKSEQEEGGFWNSMQDLLIPLEGLPDDVYRVGLQVEENNKIAYVDLPYQLTLGDSATVVKSDILQEQKCVNDSLRWLLNTGTYKLDNPFIKVDPYGISPLTAMAVFRTDTPASIAVKVAGKNGAKSLIHQFTSQTTDHCIPIYGLYPDEPTTVTFTAKYKNGASQVYHMDITGADLPEGLTAPEIVEASKYFMADGWTFVTAGSLFGYTYAFDEAGAIRWVLNKQGAGAVGAFLPLKNGHILTGGDKNFGSYYMYSLWEMDLTGYIAREYMLDGIHHDVAEMENGNFLIAGNNPDGRTKEDTIYEMDRASGNIVRTWDLNSYFNVNNVDENGYHVPDENYSSFGNDWFHNNSLDYRGEDNSVILSGRHQDAVLKLNLTTGMVDWILSDPNDTWPPELRAKLLTSIGDSFAWQYGQHCAKWLPNGDVMLFDNGNYRSKTTSGIQNAAILGYSRAVIFRIDETRKTVEQIWQFGQQYGPKLLSAYVSSVQYLEDQQYLIDFGGIVKQADGQASYNNMDGLLGSSQSHIFEVRRGRVVLHAKLEQSGLSGNTYRAQRLEPYCSAMEPALLQPGTRVGGLYRWGEAQSAVLPESLPRAQMEQIVCTDNGTQLRVSFTLPESGAGNKLYLVGKDTYCVTLPDGKSVDYTLNGSELPMDTYRLYLECNGRLCELGQRWTNTASMRSFPTGYRISLTPSDPDAGWVAGSGVYYENTPLTLIAQPKAGYQFTAWYRGDTLISNNPVYTIIPTENIALTAKFESVG